MLKILFLILMSGGLPVAIAMAGASLIYLFFVQSSPPFVVIHRMVSGIDSFPLLAVPFFILAGNLMNNAGITNRIYNYALALVGWLKGGLGHVNVVGSVVFAGMSGTAVADAGGAMLAQKSGFPVVPLAHNAGDFWPRNSFLKYPGVIKVKIGPLISTENKTTKEINAETEAWITQAMDRIASGET